MRNPRCKEIPFFMHRLPTRRRPGGGGVRVGIERTLTWWARFHATVIIGGAVILILVVFDGNRRNFRVRLIGFFDPGAPAILKDVGNPLLFANQLTLPLVALKPPFYRYFVCSFVQARNNSGQKTVKRLELGRRKAHLNGPFFNGSGASQKT